MELNGVYSFKVEWTPAAKVSLKRYFLRAQELGIDTEVLPIFEKVEQQLIKSPRRNADPLYYTKAAGGMVFRRFIYPFSVHFVVFEVQRVVTVFRFEALPPHPLAG